MKTISPTPIVRFCTALFLCVFLAPSFTSAQMVGGGAGQQTNNTVTSNPNMNEDDFYSSLNFGLLLPQGLFGQPITNPGGSYYPFNNLTLPFKGLDGLGAKTGYTLNYTMFASLNKFQVGPNSQGRIGLLFSVDIGYMPTSWSNVAWTNYNMTVSTSGFFYDGLKFGPQLNINPMDNMGVGFYFAVDPYLTIPGGENATYSGSGVNSNGAYNYTGSYDISDSSALHLNINFSAGINFYYKAFNVGIEYNWLHTKYNGSAKQDETQTYANGDVYNPSATYSFGNVVQTNILKVTIGIRFGGKGSGTR